jgi:CheY-like chemotaxis protein
MQSLRSYGSRRPRILIVDDQRLATRAISKLLKRRGCQTAEENDATKALQLARRFKPDFVLLDVSMPWKSGFELAADFAADKVLQRVPIAFITADPEQGTSGHPFPILAKPFSIEDLLACVGEGISKVFVEASESPPSPELMAS